MEVWCWYQYWKSSNGTKYSFSHMIFCLEYYQVFSGKLVKVPLNQTPFESLCVIIFCLFLPPAKIVKSTEREWRRCQVIGLMADREGEFTRTTYRLNFLCSGETTVYLFCLDAVAHVQNRSVSWCLTVAVYWCDCSHVDCGSAFSQLLWGPRTCKSESWSSHDPNSCVNVSVAWFCILSLKARRELRKLLLSFKPTIEMVRDHFLLQCLIIFI